MPILGSGNGAENWLTARTFAPLFRDGGLRHGFAERLLGEPLPGSADASLELFWRGMRDYIKERPEAGDPDDIAQCYARLFPDLRKQVGEFGRFRSLREHAYAAAEKDGLARNVKGVEIDIVLETPDHLFIGEAKIDEEFDAVGADVLVHQLVRQYVTATILLDLMRRKKKIEGHKKIVPFIVGGDKDRLHRKEQVRFLIAQHWMRRENVLDWGDVRGLASG